MWVNMGKHKLLDMITTAIIYDHRKRTKSGCEGPVEIRVTIDRRPYYINTDVRVRKSEFAHGVVINRNDCVELNERLALLVKSVLRIVNEYVRTERTIDVAEIRHRMYGKDDSESSASMLDWMKNEVERMSYNEKTIEHYRLLLRRLQQFAMLRTWSDLTVENIYRFDEWLHKLPGRISDARLKMGETAHVQSGAVHNYHKNLKALLNRAVEYGVIEQNPYSRLHGKFAASDKRHKVDYLTDDEMREFMAVPLKVGTPVAVARDLFVVQMFTGLSYSDMQALDIRDYSLVDGVWISRGERLKTGVPFVSQLLPPVVEVLERYNMQMPKMDNADYNRLLKAVSVVAGIDKRIHSHMGRHTFATWMLSHGASIENVSKMLGHTNITQTQRYAQVLAQSVRAEYNKVSNLFNTKNNEDKTMDGGGTGGTDCM